MGAMKSKYTKINNLSISNVLLEFVNDELLKNTKISPEKFWKGFEAKVKLKEVKCAARQPRCKRPSVLCDENQTGVR